MPAGTLLSYNGRDVICPPGVTSGCIEARSMLATRFNSADGTLALAYHQRKPTGGGAQIVKFHYDPVTNSGSLSAEVLISSRAADDQWQAAVDAATDGTCLVTYYDYDHNEGADRVRYRIYGRKVYADGSAITGENDTLLYSTAAAADVTRYSSFASWGYGSIYSIGEYQDFW